jgi:hypothetical protein
MFRELHLCEFSLIRDDTAEPELVTNAPPEMADSQSYELRVRLLLVQEEVNLLQGF